MANKEVKEPITIGLSPTAHEKLKNLAGHGYFNEMMDGYRFAIALALSRGAQPEKASSKRNTFVNIGSLDPERRLYEAVKALREDDSEPVWKTAESLAEWGVEELTRLAEDGEIRFGELFSKGEED